MNDGCPCKNCDTRYIGCHGDCFDYINWADEKRQYNDRINQQKHEDQLIRSDKRNSIFRAKRRNRR